MMDEETKEPTPDAAEVTTVAPDPAPQMEPTAEPDTRDEPSDLAADGDAVVSGLDEEEDNES